MKAIIVEIKGRDAAVLSDNGVVSKIKNRNYIIGQEIAIKNNNKFIKIAAAAAAAIMIFVTPAWAYLTPYSYVSLDVNPSFEFSINRFDRVLTVKAVNDDGEEFAKNINVDGLKNKEIQNAVKNVLSGLKNQGYIVEGKEGGVIVATSSKTQDKTDMLAEKLRTAVNEEVGADQKAEDIETKKTEKQKEPKKPEKPGNSEKPLKIQEMEKANDESEIIEETEDFMDDGKPEKPNKSEQSKKQKEKIDVEVIEVTKEKVDEAKDLGVTPGKLNLVEKLQEAAKSAGHDEDADDWLDSSVQEIMAKIKEYKEEASQEEKDNKNNNKKDTSNKGNHEDKNDVRDDRDDDHKDNNDRKDKKD